MTMTIKSFIETARAIIGRDYMITYAGDATGHRRTLAKVSSRGELVSTNKIWGSELTSKNCDWDNRKLCYTLQFIK